MALALRQRILRQLQDTSSDNHAFHDEQIAQVALNTKMYTRWQREPINDAHAVIALGGDSESGDDWDFLQAERDKKPICS